MSLTDKLRPTIVVVSHAVERDTQALKNFLRTNGVDAANASKDRLQKIVTTAMAERQGFAKKFRNWVIVRSGIGRFSNDDGDVSYGFGGTNYGSMPTPVYGPQNDPNASMSSAVATTTAAPSGFWTGVSLNNLLDFASSNFNTYSEVVKAQTDKAIVDAAIEKDRIALATSDSNTATGMGLGAKIGIGLLVMAAIGGIAYAVVKYNKSK